MNSLVDSENRVERHRGTKAGHPGEGEKGVIRGEMHVEKPSLSPPFRCVSSPMEDWRDLHSAVLFEFPKSRIPYTRDHATGEAAGVAEGLKRGVAHRGTVTHYAVIWGHVADAADRVRLNRSNS